MTSLPAGLLGYDAVVLAGGAGRRLGGTDKPAVEVGGVPLLDRVLTACADAVVTVVAGPPRPVVRPVSWVREDPPGSGPVAAVAAAFPLTSAPFVVLLAADLPFVDGNCLHRLLDAVGQADGALLVDADGRDQPLLAAYRHQALARRLTDIGDPGGLPLRRLIAGLDLHRLPDSAGAAFDCDTWEDVGLARVRGSAGRTPGPIPCPAPHQRGDGPEPAPAGQAGRRAAGPEAGEHELVEGEVRGRRERP